MKKAFKPAGIVMMFVVALMAAACSNEVSTANMLVGTWTCTASAAENPGTTWGTEAAGSFVGSEVVFKTDRTFTASSVKIVDDNAATGYWSIADSSDNLYINGNDVWKVKTLSETNLKIETFYVESVGLTYDTAGVSANAIKGPFSREFKRK